MLLIEIQQLMAVTKANPACACVCDREHENVVISKRVKVAHMRALICFAHFLLTNTDTTRRTVKCVCVEDDEITANVTRTVTKCAKRKHKTESREKGERRKREREKWQLSHSSLWPQKKFVDRCGFSSVSVFYWQTTNAFTIKTKSE